MLTIVCDAAPLITACKFVVEGTRIIDHLLSVCRLVVPRVWKRKSRCWVPTILMGWWLESALRGVSCGNTASGTAVGTTSDCLCIG